MLVTVTNKSSNIRLIVISKKKERCSTQLSREICKKSFSRLPQQIFAYAPDFNGYVSVFLDFGGSLT